MKLYAIVGSPNSRKVQAVINHLGIDVDIEYLDFFAGDNQQADYIALNPNAMVPTLVDGDLNLWESNAINQYLADKAGDESLYPKNPALRADINRWQAWELAHFNQAFGTLAFESIAKPNFMDMQGNAALIEWSQDKLARFALVLNAHLKEKTYMVGDRVTLADYSIIHVEFFKEMIPFDWAPYAYVNEYFDRLCQDPHWASTAPASPELLGRKPNV
ncbi:glutathione S-transferase family protein [Thalassomonas actiniarum]|uniref:Glutathione S-transferase family protein n=1 Tax=Thalassomonas actiniarum TaxID=485447 RepID=A0AAE9YTX4_9GAMM|nr:glutathione S-transferase family protein [Thalassomonas actiniarum]WDE01136.1 glutathione S-transferase family protein [Thalassomonas actiniarum]